MSNAIEQLRVIRNAYLNDFNEYVVKATATGTTIPEDLAVYMQELRDLPATVTPTLDEYGNLDQASVDWPVPPLWWWNAKGFDERGA